MRMTSASIPREQNLSNNSSRPGLTIKHESYDDTDVASLYERILTLRPERDRGRDESPWFR
jgi:hypothetical protein